MNVSATYDGSVVNIIDVDVDGTDIYISYIDASQNLKIGKKFLAPNQNQTPTLIATSVTVN
jgi:hypothetical protein